MAHPDHPARIVLADDDDRLRDMLVGLLEDLGYIVEAAYADAQSAIDRCLIAAPDVVLLDHRMPNLSGSEAAELLSLQCPGLPVIILSAYDDPGIQQAAQRAGVVSYLVKGCSAGAICDAIEAAVAHRVG